MEAATNFAEVMTSDMDVLRKMEDEHFRLQRQVRGIQADRNNRRKGVHPQFRRQDHLLEVLKEEYLDVKKDLKLARTGANKKKEKRMKIELRRALLLRTKTEQEHDEGITLMDQLEGLLQRNNKESLNLKKLVSANVGQIKERRAQSEMRLVSAENRLETAMLRFNVIQWENRKIREEIECMLKDRTLFNQAWTKMINALCKGKKFLQDLFESSTVAYDLRDEWCSKLRSMQEKGKVDQMLQIQEMRDLQKAFGNETKLFYFLAKKGVQRVNKQQEEKEELLKKKEEEEAEKELVKYNALLDEITDYAGVDDIFMIKENFRIKERENFATYELLTVYCAENVMMEKDLQRLRQNIVDRRDWNEVQETKRQDRLESLKQQIGVQQQKNQELKENVDQQEQLIKTAVVKIAELFKILNCSMEPYEFLLGDKRPSSKWLLNMTFSLMTEKINEYLEVVYYTERVLQKGVERKVQSSRLKIYTVYPLVPEYWTAVPISSIVTSDPCPACVETRWLSRVTETPEEPFTNEMTLNAIEELSNDPAYIRSDRIHALTDCRVPSSRLLSAARYVN